MAVKSRANLYDLVPRLGRSTHGCIPITQHQLFLFNTISAKFDWHGIKPKFPKKSAQEKSAPRFVILTQSGTQSREWD
jgi:hypothetical protein